jgi:hypothetical protein
VKEFVSFDVGYRVEAYSEFHGEKQFQLAAEHLAERAAQEINRYRSSFPSVNAVCSYYLRHRPGDFWPSFDAAIACALAGRVDDARRFFDEVAEPDGDDRGWVVAAQRDARELSAWAEDPKQFREIIAGRVRRTRQIQKLPSISRLDF